MGVHLDDELRVRVRDVLAGRRTTELELRRLVEEGDACERVLRGRLEEREGRLEALADAPTSSLTEIVDVLQEVRALRVHVEELGAMLAELDERARRLRAGWVGNAGDAPGGEMVGV